MSNPGNGWIILSHSHDRFPRFDEAEILDALPEQMREGPRERVRIHGTHEIGDLTRVNWAALQMEQAEQFESLVAPRRDQGLGIAYFGGAYIPLALDLGYRVENWVKHRVFQYHRHGQSWLWPGRPADSPVLEVLVEHNLPSRPSEAAGPIAVRVGVTCRIANDDVLAKVPNPIANIEIHLGAACGVSALRSPDELERVARRFEEVLYQVRDIYPHAGPIHLFAAVPVGLAFRMGTMINHTVQPLIQTYKFVQNAPIKYQIALMLGQKQQPDMKLRIQFLSAEPDTTKRLRVDRELREIAARLRDGQRREQFDIIEPRPAVRISDLQTYIRRGMAHILHFSGHGESSGHLLLEDRAGRPARVRPDSLRLLLDAWNEDNHIRCVVFNACHSHDLARELTRDASVVPCAIGTTQSVSDGAALCFAEGFYGALADGASLGKSFRAGQEQVRLEHRQEAELFVLELADESMRDRPLFSA